MSKIIAIIWDFDRTLIDGYMQEPIFDEYNVDGKKFWDEVGKLPKKYKDEQNIIVNQDTIYLNHLLNYIKENKITDLTNKKLREFGSKLKFYKGVPDIFLETTKLIEENKEYKEHGIKVEHYIVSTGFRQVIKGSIANKYAEHIWGSEFIEKIDKQGNLTISEIGYAVDNTIKTRALYEINKGVHHHEGVLVDTNIPEEDRRVHFENMIYIADGPSDVPAFSVVNKNNGSTFAIYPKGNIEAMEQVEQMRKDGRVSMFAEADYSKDTTAYLWIINKIKELANDIMKNDKAKIDKYAENQGPKHIN